MGQDQQPVAQILLQLLRSLEILHDEHARSSEKEEPVATTIGTERELSEALNNLIALDFDAIEAYEAAINRLDNATYAEQLRQFKGDHERHARELSTIVRDLGETPTAHASMQSLLTQGKVVLGNITGDKGLLRAMKSNEDDTNTAYERAVARDDLTPRLQEVLQRNLADERRHRAWLEACLARL
jgi:uncharacterized protein (TIGR02284 family)